VDEECDVVLIQDAQELGQPFRWDLWVLTPDYDVGIEQNAHHEHVERFGLTCAGEE
jgi:hypothetical protein